MQIRHPTRSTKLQNPSLKQLSFSLKKHGVKNELITMVATDKDESSMTEPYSRDIELMTIEVTTSMRPSIHNGVKTTVCGKQLCLSAPCCSCIWFCIFLSKFILANFQIVSDKAVKHDPTKDMETAMRLFFRDIYSSSAINASSCPCSIQQCLSCDSLQTCSFACIHAMHTVEVIRIIDVLYIYIFYFNNLIIIRFTFCTQMYMETRSEYY